jgi:uncharacterized protein (DUF4415 family)
MSKRKGNIETRPQADLQAMKAAGHTHTDWDAAARPPLPDGSNPDDAMEHIEWATTELPMPRRKEHESTPLCRRAHVLLQPEGRGYQTKINALLRSYVEQMTHHKPR